LRGESAKPRVFALLERWQKKPFDGLRGTAPDWLPNNVKHGFAAAQTRVASAVHERKLDFSTARRRIRSFQKAMETDRKRVSEVESGKRRGLVVYLDRPSPTGTDLDLYELASINAVLSLGKQQALNQWLGASLSKNAVSGELQREGGRKGGQRTADEKRSKASTLKSKILAAARQMLAAGTPRRGLAKKLSNRDFGIGRRQIDKILNREKLK
jgi:hypothetical protein